MADVTLSGSQLSASLPAQSVTSFVLQPAGTTPPPVNQTPVARISTNVTSGVAPLAVSFSSSASSDADGTIVSRAWNFGDGTTATGENVSHTYSKAGTFVATLTVTDDGGATASATATITVSAPITIKAPTRLSVSVTRGKVKLSWRDNATNETGYTVERAPNGTTSFVKIVTLAANAKTYADTPGKGTWLYRVQAFNGSTVSAYSNTAKIIVK